MDKPKGKDDESTKKGGDPFSEYEDTLDTFISVDDSFSTYLSVYQRPDICGAPGTVVCDERNAPTTEPSYDYVHSLAAPRDTLFNPSMSICTNYEHYVYNNPKPSKKTDTSQMAKPIPRRVMWIPKRGMLLSIVGHGHAVVWNRTNFRYEVLGTLLDCDQEIIRALALSKQEDFILVANNKGRIGCYDIFRDYQRELWKTGATEQTASGVSDISISPTNVKFVDSRENNVAYIRDIRRPDTPEHSYAANGEVRSCDWNPVSSLVALGGNGFITLTDPRTKKELHTWGFDATKVRWNMNAQWLLAPLKDNSIILFDIRKMGREFCRFTGTDDVSTVTWHPLQERVFVSGTSTRNETPSAMHFWLACGSETPIGSVKNVHYGRIHDIAWHPSGHVLATAGEDEYIKFFTRNKPGKLRTDADLKTLTPPSKKPKPEIPQRPSGHGFHSSSRPPYYQGGIGGVGGGGGGGQHPSLDKYRMPIPPSSLPSHYQK